MKEIFLESNSENKTTIAYVFSKVLIDNNIKPHLKKRIVNDLLWSCTEDTDEGEREKFKIKYWSDNAIKKYEVNCIANLKGRKRYSGLIHEHIVPRSIIRDQIFGLKDFSIEGIKQILVSFCHAAMISQEDDEKLLKAGLSRKLPNGLKLSNDLDVFVRYRQVGICLYEIQFVNDKIERKKCVLQGTSLVKNKI